MTRRKRLPIVITTKQGYFFKVLLHPVWKSFAVTVYGRIPNLLINYVIIVLRNIGQFNDAVWLQ